MYVERSKVRVKALMSIADKNNGQQRLTTKLLIYDTLKKRENEVHPCLLKKKFTLKSLDSQPRASHAKRKAS